nr:phosphoribosylanthranilate isomerase [uncultured Agathobacter sp.]
MNTQNIYNNNNNKDKDRYKDINTKINLDTNSSTKVKICGLTSPAEARFLNENHVDFAGMVLFFPKSKRNISIEQGTEIMAALDTSIKRVAVVVSPSIEQVRQIEVAGFDYIQIHGEIPEAEAVINIPILKAFNVSDMNSYEKYHNDSRIAGYVFDAIEPGSGKTFDWRLVDNIPRDEKLLLLAGGLNPDNVRIAIEAVHPDGVDVSSGVENDDGAGKNPQKIHDFVAAIKS